MYASSKLSQILTNLRHPLLRVLFICCMVALIMGPVLAGLEWITCILPCATHHVHIGTVEFCIVVGSSFTGMLILTSFFALLLNLLVDRNDSHWPAKLNKWSRYAIIYCAAGVFVNVFSYLTFAWQMLACHNQVLVSQTLWTALFWIPLLSGIFFCIIGPVFGFLSGMEEAVMQFFKTEKNLD